MDTKKLKKRGWSEKELTAAKKIIERTQFYNVFFSKIVFWSAVIVIIFANLLVSIVLIPFLVVLNKWFLDLIIILIGGTIGFLYSFLITDIKHLEKKHHLWATIIIPIIALINIIIMVTVANQLIKDIQILNIRQNPLVIGLIYGAAFILPYLIKRIIKKPY